jgi:hypothetical protein
LQKYSAKAGHVNVALQDADISQPVTDAELEGCKPAPSMSGAQRAVLMGAFAADYHGQAAATRAACSVGGWVDAELRTLKMPPLSAEERKVVEGPDWQEKILAFVDGGAALAAARKAIITAIAQAWHALGAADRHEVSIGDFCNEALRSVNLPELSGSELTNLPGPQ